MKLSSKQIIETLTYSPVKDFKRLLIAVNKHKGIKFKDRQALIDACYNGLDGHTGDVVAYELGMSVKGFTPVYKSKKRKKVAGLVKPPRNVRHTTCGNFDVAVNHNKKRYYLGTFNSLNEAILARDKKFSELGKRIPNSRDYRGVMRKKDGYYSRIHIAGIMYEEGPFKSALLAAISYNHKAAPLGRYLNEVNG